MYVRRAFSCFHSLFLIPFRVITDDWVDNARDVTNFLLHYLPPPNDSSRGKQDGSLPLYPPRVSDEVLRERKERGFVDRELVVVGHSLGGATA